ncbi:ANTAR domain-containing protein [Clostridium sp. D2Q-14]|uniref:ANTAR domain-containing response regulator n=1 Tax=Anaeromonas gelatinilytica TaxID=2683194 RepID=UPI00193C6C22|nr:ANTAR domain-containing protein [Anaeromonas gelatinilytica]MBS4534618.1 ANTAR domain-containing protein [Anaeromonas gelatinilytica]
MGEEKIVIADSGEYTRKIIKGLLIKKGYKVFEATDGLGAIRMCRTIYPELAIIDTNLWGMDAFQVGNIIEDDNLSTVIYITNNATSFFLNKIKEMKIYAYITKPIIKDSLYKTVEFSLMNIDRIDTLQNKVNILEDKLRGRKIIDKAKGILIEKYNITEEEAYKIIRKESMDKCKKIEKISKIIIDEENKNIKK